MRTISEEARSVALPISIAVTSHYPHKGADDFIPTTNIQSGEDCNSTQHTFSPTAIKPNHIIRRLIELPANYSLFKLISFDLFPCHDY